MSTEPKQVEKPSEQMHHQHQKEKEELETTALGQSLMHGWQKFKNGQLISYKWMGISLIALVAVFLTWYILSEKAQARSQLWIELENQNSRTALEEFASKNPNTLAGHIAEMDLARFLLGPDGIDKIPTARDEAERKTAIENVEKSRELMTRLLDAFKDRPILKVECLAGMAKSEAAFVGLNKPGTLDPLGSMDKLIEWLDKLAEAADGTPWGDDAKALSNKLKSGGNAKTEFVEVQRKVYVMASPFGGDGPKSPLGKSPFDPIPGLPTPDPKPPTPPMPPSITPDPPKKEGDPKPPMKDGGPKPPVKTPDPVPPPKPADPKPPEPPKK